ncbi:MAG TPA: type I methionyl aminopeptidase [Blastocatellia bacterium]|nr:type I methionyl aminopeptidase [Blastocatellia bacterium]
MIVCKSRNEIEKMRRAGAIVGRVLKDLKTMVEPGMATIDLDRYAEKTIRAAGAYPTFKGYHGFPYSLCISVNEEIVHGFPSERKLKEGDILSIDCGATLDGYVGDAALTVPVGKVSEEKAKLIKVTEESLHKAIEQARIGNRLFDISYAVQSYVEPLGYTVVRNYCGHGVGKEMHEEPQVPNYGRPGTGPKIREGWVLAIEPMVNIGTYNTKTLKDGWTVVTADGKPSAHFEHTIAITANGPEILTALPVNGSA